MELHQYVLRWNAIETRHRRVGQRGIDDPDVELDRSNASAYDVYFGTGSEPTPGDYNSERDIFPFEPELRQHVFLEDHRQDNLQADSASGEVWSFTTACGTPGAPFCFISAKWSGRNTDNPTRMWTRFECKFVRHLFRHRIKSTPCK